VTISVSGAYGGATVDFRNLAARGMTLLGRTGAYKDGVLQVAGDLADNIRRGDANYLSVLQEADAFAAAKGLDLPPEPEAHRIGPMPDCVENPLREVDLAKEGITTIVWATGFAMDYGWLQLGQFDEKGRPHHTDGVSPEKGLYFVGLPWLSCRGSAFIWGAWRDAERLAGVIAAV
jgi:putative flavoprotein involved in K+ transport